MRIRSTLLSTALFLALAGLVVGCEKQDSTGEVQSADAPKEPQKETEPAEPELAEPEAAGVLGPGTAAQQDLLLKAKEAFLANRWDEAEGDFVKLTQTGPVSGPQVTGFIALGEIYRERGDSKKAMALYEKLLKKAPEVAEAQFVVARAFAEQGETSRAIRAYEMTMKLEPDYLQAYVELGGLYAKSGREKEAQDTFLQYEKRIYSLAKKLENPALDPAEQLHVLDIFSFVQDDRANQAIVAALKSPQPRVREKAVDLVEDLRIGGVTDQIKEMAQNDPDLRVRMIAKAAIESITGAPLDGSKPTFVDDPSKLPVKP